MRRVSTPALLYCCSLALAVASAAGCAGSTDTSPGTGGSNGTGTAGTGTTTGSAGTGTTTGSAGTSGSAGTTGSGATGGNSSTGTAGSSGTAGAGATMGTGGMPRGGTTGTAGRGGTNGTAGTGGSAAGASGSAGTTGGGGNCATATATTSTKIPTVGIVTWSTTMAGATSAKIDFGLTTSYGMSAPVATLTSSNRTLLLGMKAAKMYHYRITVMAGGSSCTSPDYTIMTGNLASGLAKPTLSPATASATGVFGGFLITGQYVQGAGAGATAYILDGDGDYVWWYSIGSDVTGARMSYDGTHMWINSANVPDTTAHVRRVTMDGMMEDNLDSKFAHMNHQLTVLPDETVAFYAYSSGACDDIKEYSPSGTVKTIANSGTVLKQSSACHLNNIQYSPSDDTLVFSDLDHTQIAKIKRTDGSTVWIMNGSTKTLSGDTWAGGEHGIHIIDPTHYLIFNNNSVSGNNGSAAIEMQLDSATNPTKAMKIWSYTASPAQMNMVMGDVQRMSNGNTIVGYSTRGTLHEVDSSSKLLQTWTFNNSFGYIEKRASLYGPPPK